MKKDALDYEALLPEVDERLKNGCSKEQEQLFYSKTQRSWFFKKGFFEMDIYDYSCIESTTYI